VAAICFSMIHRFHNAYAQVILIRADALRERNAEGRDWSYELGKPETIANLSDTIALAG
jgi:hypothetical protein